METAKYKATPSSSGRVRPSFDSSPSRPPSCITINYRFAGWTRTIGLLQPVSASSDDRSAAAGQMGVRGKKQNSFAATSTGTAGQVPREKIEREGEDLARIDPEAYCRRQEAVTQRMMLEVKGKGVSRAALNSPKPCSNRHRSSPPRIPGTSAREGHDFFAIVRQSQAQVPRGGFQHETPMRRPRSKKRKREEPHYETPDRRRVRFSLDTNIAPAMRAQTKSLRGIPRDLGLFFRVPTPHPRKLIQTDMHLGGYTSHIKTRDPGATRLSLAAHAAHPKETPHQEDPSAIPRIPVKRAGPSRFDQERASSMKALRNFYPDRLPSFGATVVTGQGREDGDGDKETRVRKRARTAAWTAGLATGTKITERSTWPMMAGRTQDLLEIRQPKPVRGWERSFLHSSRSDTIYDKYRESSPSPRRGTPAPWFEIPDQADILEKPKERTPPRSLSSVRVSLKRPLTPNDQAPEAERATKRRCSTTTSSEPSRDALDDHLSPAAPSHAMSGLSVRLRQDQCSLPPTPPWPELYLLDLPENTSIPIPSYPPTPTSTTTSVRPTEARAKFLLQEIGRLVRHAHEARKDLADSLAVLNAANERQKKIHEELERVRRRRKVAERFYAAVRKGEQTVESFRGSLGRARHRGEDRRGRIEEDERGLV